MDPLPPHVNPLQTHLGDPNWWVDFWTWWLVLVCLVGLWIVLPTRRK